MGIRTVIFSNRERESRHAICCCGEPAHAQDGHEQASTLTLTHLRSPPSSELACHDRTPPVVAAIGESGRWPSLLLTVLDACECHSRTEGNTERKHRSNPPHPHYEGRRCISEPASSQPGASRRQDSPRRNLRPLARRGGQAVRGLVRNLGLMASRADVLCELCRLVVVAHPRTTSVAFWHYKRW